MVMSFGPNLSYDRSNIYNTQDWDKLHTSFFSLSFVIIGTVFLPHHLPEVIHSVDHGALGGNEGFLLTTVALFGVKR